MRALAYDASARTTARSVLIASGVFVLLGTIAALWPNPLFTRMTPTSGFELIVLAGQAILAGLYIGIQRKPTGHAVVGTGNVLAFLGVACPVCNKLLLLAFGSALLLEYFEPVRLDVGLVGLGLIGYALWRKLTPRLSCSDCVTVPPGNGKPGDPR